MQPLQGRRDRGARIGAALDLAADQMRDHFGVGLAGEGAAVGDQLLAQRPEILDDAVMDQGDLVGRVRMGIVAGRRAVGRPARVRDADLARQRVRGELAREIVELALGAAPFELAVDDRADPGRIIAAIFEPPEALDQPVGNLITAQICR